MTLSPLSRRATDRRESQSDRSEHSGSYSDQKFGVVICLVGHQVSPFDLQIKKRPHHKSVEGRKNPHGIRERLLVSRTYRKPKMAYVRVSAFAALRDRGAEGATSASPLLFFEAILSALCRHIATQKIGCKMDGLGNLGARRTCATHPCRHKPHTYQICFKQQFTDRTLT